MKYYVELLDSRVYFTNKDLLTDLIKAHDISLQTDGSGSKSQKYHCAVEYCGAHFTIREKSLNWNEVFGQMDDQTKKRGRKPKSNNRNMSIS